MNWKKNVNLFLSMMLAFSTLMSDMTVYAEGEEETEEPVIEEVTEIEETAVPEVTEIVSEMEEMTDNVISEENGSEEEITDVTGSEEAEPEEDLSEQTEELASEEDNSSEEIQTEEEEPVISFASSGDFEYSISDGEAIIDKYSGSDAEVTIPSQIDGYTVTGIAKNVFSSNKDLTKISLPATLKSIGQSAFSNCENLNDVQIPNSVASIGSSAFMSCKSITSITIPDSVTSIGSFAFGYCNNLASVTISGNVTSIGGEVFKNCPKLKTAGPIGSNCDIEYGWTTMIPYEAFSYTESLTSIKFPQGIKEIGGSAFSGCSGLTSVEIPETVTRINPAAFSGCTGLSSVKIPHFLMMDNSVFYGCTELKTAGPIGSGSNFEFGWSDSIPANAFNGDNCLTSIVIPEGVTYIGYDAFDGCTDLASATLPGSLTEISAYQSGIFNNCPKLTTAGPIGSGSNIEFGWTTSIPAYAFSECSSLTSVVIPEGITEIGGLAFSKCTDLTKVIIPESVAEMGSVGSGIFRDNPKLVSAGPIDSDSNIEFGWTAAIPERAFYDCKYLSKVIIPSGITEIGYTAFNNCEGLKTAGPTGSDSNIEFPWTDEIPDSAFSGCTGLTKVTIPDTVTSIGKSAFSWCTNLTDITLPDGITSIGSSAFSVCSSLSKINIPKNVTFIVASVFSRCSSLISIEIPYGVTNIGGDAFRSCTSLASVTIPETMGEIYNGAFTECSAIKDVYYSGTEEDWQKIKIGSNNTYLLNATIHYKPVALRELQINAEDGEIILHAGENRTLEVTRIPASSAEQLYWDSSDENTLTVDQNGTVTAVKSGSAVITVRNEDGSVSDTVEIIVAVEVTGITLNKTEGTLAKGGEDQLTATVKPDNATIKDVKWSSSDQMVVKVDANGHVTAVGGGTAVVTAEADGGLTASCTYTVLVPVTGVLAEESMIAFIGKDTSLNYQIKPSDATNKNVTFTVGNTEIAKVSTDGVITGLKLGETDITIKTEDGGYQAVVHVTVVPDGIYMDLIEESYAYTGSAIKPAVRLYDQGTLLKEKTDYTVTYANNTKAGTAKITIKMAKDYKGTITKTFEITPVDLNDPSVTCDALTLAETGKTLSPVPAVYFNGKKLKAKTDYIVDYTGWDRLTGDENNE
ncbi:MAG: leucine-rich repeat protein, partial [Erysipelotrichaceae bacterium]|nr:leucine-rich repeat protein [Erysipelotrichaceae bacterium]